MTNGLRKTIMTMSKLRHDVLKANQDTSRDV